MSQFYFSRDFHEEPVKMQVVLDNNCNFLSAGVHRKKKEFLWLSVQLQLWTVFAERTPKQTKMTKVVAVN